MKIKSILISQPESVLANSPYQKLKDKHRLHVVFKPFIEIIGLSSREIREQKVNFTNFDSIILTSRKAVDYYFHSCKEMRYEVPKEKKFFCFSESIARYLRKYVIFRKRKIYYGIRNITDLLPSLKRFSTETFLLPTSDSLNLDITNILDSNQLKWQRITLYRRVLSDLKDIDKDQFDLVAFFSPGGIEAWVKAFPDVRDNKLHIAVSGKSTADMAEKKGLNVHIKAATKENPSMSEALEKYVVEFNKKQVS